jgi:hypothetical protein
MADVLTSNVKAKLVPVNVDLEMLYSDKPSKDKQLSVRAFLLKKLGTARAIKD